MILLLSLIQALLIVADGVSIILNHHTYKNSTHIETKLRALSLIKFGIVWIVFQWIALGITLGKRFL